MREAADDAEETSAFQFEAKAQPSAVRQIEYRQMRRQARRP